MDPRVLCPSVDVDALRLYRQIHGLEAVGGADALDPAWALGVPRFLALFDEVAVRATFFVVGQDLEDPRVRDIVREIVARGHEVASHSYTHPYDLIQRGEAAIREELERAHAALAEATGVAPSGYRAPGYNQTPAVRAELVRLGYRYDSSAFPCPAYVAAKAALIALKRLGGRRSRSIIARPWEALASRTPRRARTSHGPLWSLPISVLPKVRFPLIGTSLTMVGERGLPLLLPVIEGMGYLNIEFHAVDLMALTDEGVPPELEVQPDLKVSVETKRAIYATFVREAARGRRVLPLARFAETLAI